MSDKDLMHMFSPEELNEKRIITPFDDPFANVQSEDKEVKAPAIATQPKVSKKTKDTFRQVLRDGLVATMNWNKEGNKPTSIADYENATNLVASATDIKRYNGVYVARDWEGVKVLKEPPIKMLTSEIAKYELNISPKIASDLATATVQRVEDISVKLNDNYIYFANGFFDVRTGKFTNEPSPEYNHRRLPHAYKKPEDDTIKVFQEFINQYAEGRKELASQLIEVMGAIMLPTKMFRKAFFLVGTGGQGKSGFMDFTREVIGVNGISNVSLTNLSGSNQFHRLPLVNKMGNFIDDLDQMSVKENSVFKSLVAGGTVNAEVKGGAIISMTNEATIFANANNIPQLNDRGSSHAITDRLHIIKLTNKIKKDLAKYERVMQEDVFSAAAWLAAQAMHKCYKNNWTLTETDDSKASLDEFKYEQDSVFRWLTDVPHFFDSDSVDAADAYLQYKLHIGAFAVNDVNFGKAMKRLKPELIKKQIKKDGVIKRYYIKGEQ